MPREQREEKSDVRIARGQTSTARTPEPTPERAMCVSRSPRENDSQLFVLIFVSYPRTVIIAAAATVNPSPRGLF